ncbi:MAG: DUF308 domain-containing protein [Muribaculaceae bacterium]|nr:DUF308 domain-containing protein [Muribaculaceae bacterium]MDE6612075.1 DUF308 domain-containing protein [Muribaculaceae bacterium]
MKGRNLFFAGLAVAAVGLLLILFRVPLADGGVVTAGGILFVLAGALNMFVFLRSRDKDGRAGVGAFATVFGWIASAAAVVLGLAMLIFSEAFVAIVGFMFAILLLLTALAQLFILLIGSRPVKLSGWYFLVPIVSVACAIFIFMRKPDAAGETVDLIVTGSAFILFGLAAVLEGLTIGNLRRRARKSAKAASETVLRGGSVASEDVQASTPTTKTTDLTSASAEHGE